MTTDEIDKPRCHCAVFGVFGHPSAAQMTYYGLLAQQHRGQEGSGMVTAEDDQGAGRFAFMSTRHFGLVDDVYKDERVLTDLLTG